MDKIWLWMLISIVLGTVAALIFVFSGARRAGKHSKGACDEAGNYDSAGVDSSGNDEEDDDTDDGRQVSRHTMLVVCIFSVLAFVILWLVMALCDERVRF